MHADSVFKEREKVPSPATLVSGANGVLTDLALGVRGGFMRLVGLGS